ncbi:MAG: acyl-CoA dehydrogenase family protein [Oscillospiraceae bacterium]|nr:acyl-CoA dehydrogenase family protein [Oscillospiraceae bacterium]
MLDREHLMIQQLAREFAVNEIAPAIDEAEEAGEFPDEVWEKLARYGFTGCCIPREYGGQGGDFFSSIVMMEQICRTSVSAASMLMANSLSGMPILKCGTEEQKQKYLRPVAEGKKRCAFALTEPGAGSDTNSISTTARPDGDDFILNGRKTFITLGPTCDWAVVFAKTPIEGRKPALTAFIVEAAWPGFSRGKREKKLGLHASGTCDLIFEDVRVPKENVLGTVGGGWKVAGSGLSAGRINVASQSLGGAQGCLDEAIKYAGERTQFGKPIGKFQNTRFVIAEMAAKIEAGRQLVYSAAQMQDSGQDALLQASLAKYYMSETANEVAYKCLQIHGGYGYMEGFAIERFYRDLRVMPVYEGTSEVQLMVISSALMK